MDDLPNIKPFGDKSITDCIADVIINAVAEKKWRPGSKIPTEMELANKLGVSRNSVREAVKILTALGILEICRPNGTFVVKSFNSKMLNSVSYSFILEDGASTDLYEFRKMFEEAFMRLAIVKATTEDKAAIQKASDDLTRYLRSGGSGAETLLELDMALHNAIVDATHNKLVTRMNEIINKVTYTSRLKALWNASQEDRLDDMLVSHREIARVVVEKDHGRVFDALEVGYGEWPQTLRDE